MYHNQYNPQGTYQQHSFSQPCKSYQPKTHCTSVMPVGSSWPERPTTWLMSAKIPDRAEASGNEPASPAALPGTAQPPPTTTAVPRIPIMLGG